MKLTIGDSAWWEYTEHKKNHWQDSYYKVSAGDQNADGTHWSVCATLSAIGHGSKYEGKLEIEWKRPTKETALKEFVLDKAKVRDLTIMLSPGNWFPGESLGFLVDSANELLEAKP